MKIAISASGKGLESPFEPRFGRANGFIVFDTETGDTQYLDNTTNQNLSQGAGLQTAQMITESGAQALITGNVGPKASRALSTSSLQIFNCEAQTVSEALRAFQSGDNTRPNTENSNQSAPASGTGSGRGRGPGQGGRGMGGGARGRGMKGGGRGKGGGGGMKKGGRRS